MVSEQKVLGRGSFADLRIVSQNPVRSLGPSVISGVFPSEHWVYYAGPFLGSLFATLLYVLLKVAEYELAVGKCAGRISSLCLRISR